MNEEAMDDVRLRRIEMDVCDLCLSGAGGECHWPGCAFWIHEAPTGEVLDVLNRHWAALPEVER